MNEKVVLILVDGMRPDAFIGCGNAYANTLLSECSYTLNAKTVMPSVTLPVHFSIFHSVPPSRHGVTTNIYTPQIRPIEGLFEALSRAGKRSAMFYSWNELRDVSRPDALSHSLMRKYDSCADVDGTLTNDAVSYINEFDPDFVFLYLGETDHVGHDFGWMSANQLASVSHALDCIKKVIDATPGRTVIIAADHGGHERMHGCDIPEDMTVPLLLSGKHFAPGKKLDGVSVVDIAPTVAELIGVLPPREWEGRALTRK